MNIKYSEDQHKILLRHISKLIYEEQNKIETYKIITICINALLIFLAILSGNIYLIIFTVVFLMVLNSIYIHVKNYIVFLKQSFINKNYKIVRTKCVRTFTITHRSKNNEKKVNCSVFDGIEDAYENSEFVKDDVVDLIYINNHKYSPSKLLEYNLFICPIHALN